MIYKNCDVYILIISQLMRKTTGKREKIQKSCMRKRKTEQKVHNKIQKKNE